MPNGPDQQDRQDCVATGSSRFARSTLLQLLVLCGAGFALYAETLRNGFVADDGSEVLRDPLIQKFRDVSKMFAHSVWYFSGADGDRYYRPLKLLAYSVEYHLFHFQAVYWHLINVVVNVGVVVAIYFLVRSLAAGGVTGRKMRKEGAKQLAFCTALVFAFHPIHTEAVAWIAAGNDLWCGLALVLALWLYHRGRSGLSPIASYGLSVLLFFVALLFKETALTFPAIVLAYDFLYLGEDAGKLARSWRRYAGYFVALAGYLAMRWHALGSFAPNNPRNVLTAVQLALTIPVLVARYVWKTLVPIHLNAWYTFHAVSHFGWQAAGAMALCLFLVWAVFRLRRREPMLAFSVAWFWLTLIPVLDIPKLGINVFTERYLYIPTFGFCVIVAWGWQWLVDRSPRPALSRLAYAAIAALLAFYSFVAVRRLAVWRSNYTLWTKTVRQDPRDAIVLDAAGAVYLGRHEYDHALPLLQRAVALAPDQGYPHNTLGGVYFDLHQYDLALREYRQAVAFGPGVPAYWRNLGVVYANEQRWPESVDAFARAVSLSLVAAPPAPTHEYYAGLSLLYVQYGTSLENDAQLDKAASAFRSAVQADPQRLDAYIALARALSEQPRLEEAAAVLQSGLRANPNSAQAYLAHLALGRIYIREGKKAEAQKEYQQALALSSASGPQPAHFAPLQYTGPEKAKRIP